MDVPQNHLATELERRVAEAIAVLGELRAARRKVRVTVLEGGAVAVVWLVGAPSRWPDRDIERLAGLDPLVLAKQVAVAAQGKATNPSAVGAVLAPFRAVRRVEFRFLDARPDDPVQGRLPGPTDLGPASVIAGPHFTATSKAAADLAASVPSRPLDPIDRVFAAVMGGDLVPERRRVPVADLRLEPGSYREEFVERVMPDAVRLLRVREERDSPVLVMERSDGSLWVYDDCHFVRALQAAQPDAVVPCGVVPDPTR